MDASKLGTTVKEGKNQKTLLSPEEEDLIINTLINIKPWMILRWWFLMNR